MNADTTTFASPAAKVVEFAGKTRIRWLVVAILFTATAINYGDRSALAITGPVISKEFGLTPGEMGLIFSAFGWAYVAAQLPGGWALDRFGSKRIYGLGILIWSILTVFEGFVGFLAGGTALTALFCLRFMIGLAEAPSFPGNGRIVAAWFPKRERGTAASIFNSAQYFATVIFAPLMGWLTHAFGWQVVFFTMAGLGLIMAVIWANIIHSPAVHPWANHDEIAYIENGGGLVNMDNAKVAVAAGVRGNTLAHVRQMFGSRMLCGVFLGQYCINAITYFFITWFPVYLVQARGMSLLGAGLAASVPAICGFAGGLLGGVTSDALIRRGLSLTAARKTPIVIGMALSMSMVACNYIDTQWMIVGFMALAFFGKGFGALGWAVMSDCAPKEATGLANAVFNMCGNIASITTPLVIGYIIQATGSFNGALVFVGANGLIAVVSYLLVVGEIKRLELQPQA